jgi:hypothetical protein
MFWLSNPGRKKIIVSMRIYKIRDETPRQRSIKLTLILATWTKWWAPASASKWRMGFNSAFKGLSLILLTSTKWWAPASASKWRMWFNSAFKGLNLSLSVLLIPHRQQTWRVKPLLISYVISGRYSSCIQAETFINYRWKNRRSSLSLLKNSLQCDSTYRSL